MLMSPFNHGAYGKPRPLHVKILPHQKIVLKSDCVHKKYLCARLIRL